MNTKSLHRLFIIAVVIAAFGWGQFAVGRPSGYKGRDFTVPQSDSYAPGKLMVRFAPKANQQTVQQAGEKSGSERAWRSDDKASLQAGAWSVLGQSAGRSDGQGCAKDIQCQRRYSLC